MTMMVLAIKHSENSIRKYYVLSGVPLGMNLSIHKTLDGHIFHRDMALIDGYGTRILEECTTKSN
jgi:hypothetical protein